MDPWPVVVIVGFGLATVLVIVLARSSTVRWERQRTLARRRSIRREVRAHGHPKSSVPRSRRGSRRRRRGRPRVPGGS